MKTKRLFRKKKKVRKTRKQKGKKTFILAKKTKVYFGGALKKEDIDHLSKGLRNSVIQNLTEHQLKVQRSYLVLATEMAKFAQDNGNEKDFLYALRYFQAIYDERLLNIKSEQSKLTLKEITAYNLKNDQNYNLFSAFLDVDDHNVRKLLGLASKCLCTYTQNRHFPGWVISIDEWSSYKFDETRVFYSEKDMATPDQRVIDMVMKREPANVTMVRFYDQQLFKELFGYQFGGYSQSTELKLMPNIAIYTDAVVIKNGNAGEQLQNVHVINLVGYGFDDEEQPDYKYFSSKYGLKENSANIHPSALPELVRLYEQMWLKAYGAAKYLKDAGKGITSIYLFDVGGSAFKALAPIITNFVVDVFAASFSKVKELFDKENIKIRGLQDPNDLQKGFLPRQAFDIPKSLFSDKELLTTLYVNAWDPWSLIGNGNEQDGSLDGYWGRNSNMSVLGWGVTNPFINADHKQNYINVYTYLEEQPIVDLPAVNLEGAKPVYIFANKDNNTTIYAGRPYQVDAIQALKASNPIKLPFEYNKDGYFFTLNLFKDVPNLYRYTPVGQTYETLITDDLATLIAYLLEKYDIEFNSDKLDANGALIGKKEVKETTATNDSNKQLANTNVQTSEPKEQKAALPEVTNPLFEAEMFYTEKYPKIIFEYWNADFLTIPGADTVVNGANDRLHLGDGLAGAIASADDDNQQVQQTCNKIMANRNGKKLDTGSAINTLGPSNFPNIKKIIHAIPPQLPKIPAGKKIDESDKIFFKKAIQSTLREATQEKTFYKLDANNNLIEENFQTKVLVFPPIGTGLFHYPFEVGVKEIVDLTIQYIWLALIKNPEYQLGEIQKIIFCDTYIPPAHKHKTKAEIDEQNQYKNKVWLDTLNAERNKGNDKFRKLTNVPPPVPIRAEAEAEAAPPPVPVRVTAPPVPVRVTEEAPPPVPIRSESAPPPVPIRSAAPVPIRSAAPVRVEAVRETTVPVRAAAAAVPVPPVLLSKNKQLYMFHQQFTDDKNTNISVNTNTDLSNALNYVINNPSKLPYTDKFNSIYINNTQFPEIYRCENNYFYGVISYNLDQLHKYLKQSSNLTFSKENPLKGYDKNPILPLHVREKLPTNPNVTETTRKKTPSFKPSSTLASESFVKNKSPLKKHTVSVTPTISSLSRPLKASSSSSSFHTLKKPKYYEVPTIKMGKPSTNNKKRTVRRQNSYNDDYNYNDDYSSSYYPLSKYNDNGLRQKKPTKWSQHKLLLFDLNKKRFLLLGRHTLAANMYDTLILGGDLTRDDTYPYIFKESRSYAELFLLKDDRRKTKYLITMNDEEHYQDVKDYLARARIRY